MMAIKLDPMSRSTSVELLGSFKADIPANWWIEGIQVDTNASLVALWSGQLAMFYSMAQV
jgi:hypothetical protein